MVFCDKDKLTEEDLKSITTTVNSNGYITYIGNYTSYEDAIERCENYKYQTPLIFGVNVIGSKLYIYFSKDNICEYNNYFNEEAKPYDFHELKIINKMITSGKITDVKSLFDEKAVVAAMIEYIEYRNLKPYIWIDYMDSKPQFIEKKKDKIDE